MPRPTVVPQTNEPDASVSSASKTFLDWSVWRTMLLVNASDDAILTWWADALPHKDQEATFEDGKTLLHAAVGNFRPTLVDRLLELGACVNTQNQQGLSPLWTAVSLENWALAQTLIDHGASLNVTDADGNDLLSWVVMHSEQGLRFLIVDNRFPLSEEEWDASLMLCKKRFPEVVPDLEKERLRRRINVSTEPSDGSPRTDVPLPSPRVRL